MIKIDEKLLLRAISVFGVQSQINKCREECCELAVAIDHLDDTSESIFRLADEVADVIITLNQVEKIIRLDDGWGKLLDNRLIKKLDRLRDLVDKAEKEKAIAGNNG